MNQISKVFKGLLSPNQQTRGPVVLLLAKAFGLPGDVKKRLEIETHHAVTVREKQRTLAKITDMIHLAHMIHRGVVDIKSYSNRELPSDKDNLHFNNIISILIGDYLLATSSCGLAEIRNPVVCELNFK